MSTRCRLDEKVATLAGKRIVVTGGATGIGFATARLAAERGATVVLMSRNESRLQSAVEAIGDDSSAHVVDVTDADAVARALDSIGPLDHLISSAAGLLQGPFRELSEKAVRSFFEVKFWGQYRTLRAALPYLAADGSAVLVSGFLYRKARPGLSPFADRPRHPGVAPRRCRSGASGRTDRDTDGGRACGDVPDGEHLHHRDHLGRRWRHALTSELGGGTSRSGDTLAECRQTQTDWRRSPTS